MGGLPSYGQLRDAKIKEGPRGRHGRILAKKAIKRMSQQERRKAKKNKERLQQPKDDSRGRSATPGSDARAASKSVGGGDVSMKPARDASVKPGHGSGTVGARLASKKVAMMLQEKHSKRGGRRRKPTWRAMGMR